MVSTATRLSGSCRSSSSRIASLIASQILSGWPSVTDSEVKRREVTAGILLLWGSRSLASWSWGKEVVGLRSRGAKSHCGHCFYSLGAWKSGVDTLGIGAPTLQERVCQKRQI